MKKTNSLSILFITCLILIDAYALFSLSKAKNEVRKVNEAAFLAHYALESSTNIENAILSPSDIIVRFESLYNDSTDFKKLDSNNQVDIYFLFRGDDCTNCIVQTWEMLAELKQKHTYKIRSIKSFFHQNGGAKLKPLLSFNNLRIPTQILDFNKWLIENSITATPFVMVVGPNSKQIIDAYQPEPNNHTRRAAFLQKWDLILETY